MVAMYFGLLINALLFGLGVLWCGAIFKRLPSDLSEFKRGDATGKSVILFYWGITVVVLLFLVSFLWRLIYAFVG